VKTLFLADLQDTAIDKSLLRESQVLHITDSRNTELDATVAWARFS